MLNKYSQKQICEGLDESYPATITWDFLGNSYTEETSDVWFMWADDSSTFELEETVFIDSSERFDAITETQWSGFVATVTTASATPTGATKANYGVGEIYIDSNGDVFIYS